VDTVAGRQVPTVAWWLHRVRRRSLVIHPHREEEEVSAHFSIRYCRLQNVMCDLREDTILF